MNRALILLIVFSYQGFGQEEFSFPIHFEDKAGNKDTVIFGYDSLGTDGIDSLFGEKNISNEAWDTTLDVRLSNYFSWDSSRSAYETKKQIANKDCSESASVFKFKILTRSWPVTASWDSSLFVGSCLSTTTFSSVISDGIGGSQRIIDDSTAGFVGFVKFQSASKITFTEQSVGIGLYIDEINAVATRTDTLNYYWISLNEESFYKFIVPIREKQKDSFPILSFKNNRLKFFQNGISRIEIFSALGKRQTVIHVSGGLDLSHLTPGVFILKYSLNGEEYVTSVQK